MTLAVCVALGGAGYVIYQKVTRPGVLVTQVIQGPVVQAFYATGTLLPEREYPIRSSVDGFVLDLHVLEPNLPVIDKGSVVRQGQVVALVRVPEHKMQYAQALADLTLKRHLADEATSPMLREFDAKIKAATEQLEIAKRDFSRVAELRTRNAASESDYDRGAERVQEYWKQMAALQAARATRRAELQRDAAVAQAALEIAQWNLDQGTLKAPVDGVVLDRPVSAGTHVRSNDLLLTMADVRPAQLVMRANVDEEDKTRLTLGQKVNLTLYAYPGRVFQGTVRTVYPKADADRRTFEVDVTISPVDDRFAAGMTGELAFVVATREQTLIVPSQAVWVSGDAGEGEAHGVTPWASGVVWVLTAERCLQKRAVVVGLRNIERTEILQGLQLGERIVLNPVEGLEDGRAVTPTFLDPAKAAGLNKKAEVKVTKFN